MKRDFILYFLMNVVCLCRSHKRFVNYTRVGSASGSSSYDRITCAEACADNQFLAARINDTTGICEGLTWDLGSDPQYEAKFTYIRKIETIEIYDPVLRLGRYNWLIPGSFGVGAWLEFYITIPTGDWDEFVIDILDSTHFSYDVYDGETEVILLHMRTRNTLNSIEFKTWTGGWSNKDFLSPIPFVDGDTHKITIVPHAQRLQILLDDKQVAHYTHPTDPSTAKQIIFNTNRNTVLKLHNITFIGI